MIAAFLIAAAAAAAALPAQHELESALLDGIAGSCPGHKVALDLDLSRAARRFAQAARDGIAPVEGSALSFYASLESTEPAAVAGVGTIAPRYADRAVSDLFPKACRFDRIGTAAAVLPSGDAVVAVLVARHTADLARIPGSVEPGATVQISGKLLQGLHAPRLFVTRPGGSVDEIPLSAEGDRFATRVTVKAPGEHSIEVLAEGEGGPQVAAIRRVFAGIPPPAAPPEVKPLGPGLSGVEAAIAQLRAAHGLPALQRDPELDAAARRHSEEMVKLRTFAHVLPTDGALGDRLRARGYAYRSAGENIGLSDSPASAHEAIVGSPAHLANLLDPRHRRLGLGIASGPSPDGDDAVYLTEVLAAPIVGSRDPAADVLHVIQAERKKRGLPPLNRDPRLEELATKEVRAVALSDKFALAPDLVKRALDQSRDLESAAAEIRVGGGAEDVSSSKNIAEARWTRLGVGTIYATSKTYGPGRLWIVLLYAR